MEDGLVTLWALEMLQLYKDASDGFGGLRPWRSGGGVLEMPARELAALRIIRAALADARERRREVDKAWEKAQEAAKGMA